jgi:hypothetical protein
MRKVDPIEEWFSSQKPSVQALAIVGAIPALAIGFLVAFLGLLLVLFVVTQLFGGAGIVLFVFGFIYAAVYAAIKFSD